MADVCRAIKLLHPGGEHGPDHPGGTYKSWNSGPHARKFMRGSGRIVSGDRSGTTADSEFLFWGEWEPPSSVEEVGHRQDVHGPESIHTPLYPSDSEIRNARAGLCQNTDPYVFGSRFKYVVCLQPSRPTLRALDRGSVVLFGSCKAKKFVLDTVFVVKRWIPWTDPQALFEQTVRDEEISDLYRTVSIRTMIEDPGRANEPGCTPVLQELEGRSETPVMRLYIGASYEDRNDFGGTFSYVPCRVGIDESAAFARPALEIPGAKGTQTQNFKGIGVGAQEARDLWENVYNQVREARLDIAVQVNEPIRRH